MLRLSRKAGQVYVWCIVRKKNLVLTPEEWVRQHVIHYLINAKQVPEGLISSELRININRLDRRCDVVIYGKDQQAKLLVECKAPEVTLTDRTLQQIAHYNAQLGVDFLWVTNGIRHAVYQIDRHNKKITILEELPDFTGLSQVM